MERTITLTSTVRELNTVLHALINASIDADCDAWLASTQAQQNPEDPYYEGKDKVMQANKEAMRKALDYMFSIVWSASDEAGHFVDVQRIAEQEAEVILQEAI